MVTTQLKWRTEMKAEIKKLIHRYELKMSELDEFEELKILEIRKERADDNDPIEKAILNGEREKINAQRQAYYQMIQDLKNLSAQLC